MYLSLRGGTQEQTLASLPQYEVTKPGYVTKDMTGLI